MIDIRRCSAQDLDAVSERAKAWRETTQTCRGSGPEQRAPDASSFRPVSVRVMMC